MEKKNYLTDEVVKRAHENMRKIVEAGKKHGLTRHQMNYLKMADNISPLKAIKLWCYQCNGFTREECTLKSCPLYLYRKPGLCTEENKKEWHRAFNKSWADLKEFPDTPEIEDLTYEQILKEAGVSDDLEES